MAISVLGLDGNAWTTRDMDATGNNFITTYHLLSFSGSYTTAVGGDTLDLSAIASQIPAYGLPLQITYEMNGPSTSFGGLGNYLQFAKGSLLTNNKMQAYAHGGAEEGTQTYLAMALTTDVVTLLITWRKLTSLP